MTYNCIKLFHIFCASLLIAGVAYSYRLWRQLDTDSSPAAQLTQIQRLTWLAIIPLAVMQLCSGFTMISLKHYAATEFWISGSTISFITMISSWLGFTYFLVAAQPNNASALPIFYKRAQTTCLILFKIAFVLMIFFMASKLGTSE
jgi:uncharacterized membrane protein